MIPITFNKDDSLNLKKGNIRGQDLASIISFGLPKVAGLLDIWNNPVSVISNVAGTGYSTFTMSKGYIVVYGRLIYVEQGEQVQVALPSSGTVNGVFGVRINLGQTGSQEVTWFTKTSELQVNNLLNDEVNGVYEFGIYNYTATPSGITLGTKIAPIIPNINAYLESYLQSEVFVTQPVNDNSTKAATTEFVTRAVNNAKNIISGDISIPVATTSISDKWVKRQVNFVIGKLRYDPAPYALGFNPEWIYIGHIPEGFRPKTQFNTTGIIEADYYGFTYTSTYYHTIMGHDVIINTDGSIFIKNKSYNKYEVRQSCNLIEIQFGYEITA